MPNLVGILIETDIKVEMNVYNIIKMSVFPESCGKPERTLEGHRMDQELLSDLT